MYKIVEIENSTIKKFKSNLITKYFSKVGTYSKTWTNVLLAPKIQINK